MYAFGGQAACYGIHGIGEEAEQRAMKNGKEKGQ